MFKGKGIIQISNNYFDELRLSKQSIAEELALTNTVLYVNPPVNAFSLFYRANRAKYFKQQLVKKSANLYVLTPKNYLPFQLFHRTFNFNTRLIKRAVAQAATELCLTHPILWIEEPTAEGLIGQFGEELVVYHCTDDFPSIGRGRYRSVEARENKLAARADIVFASSPQLVHDKIKINPQTFYLPHAFDEQYFPQLEKKESKPEEINHLQKIIGYVGSINERIDINLIKAIARKFQDATLVLIGPVKYMENKEELRGLVNSKNILLIKPKPKAELFSYIKYFTAGIIPYKNNAFNRASFPLKIYDYLALGKPAVTIELEAFRHFSNLLYPARTEKEFLDKLEQALQENDPALTEKRKEFVRANSWRQRLSEADKLITAKLDENFRDK